MLTGTTTFEPAAALRLPMFKRVFASICGFDCATCAAADVAAGVAVSVTVLVVAAGAAVSVTTFAVAAAAAAAAAAGVMTAGPAATAGVAAAATVTVLVTLLELSVPSFTTQVSVRLKSVPPLVAFVLVDW